MAHVTVEDCIDKVENRARRHPGLPSRLNDLGAARPRWEFLFA